MYRRNSKTVTLKYSAEGSGETQNYSYGPFSGLQISNVIIEEGVKGIGNKVFLNSNITNATIAQSVN